MEADRIQREKENAVREKAARAARSDITSRYGIVALGKHSTEFG